MKKAPLVASISLLSFLIVDTAMAQISSDGTLSTRVDFTGTNFVIEDGDRTGNNLFQTVSASSRSPQAVQ